MKKILGIVLLLAIVGSSFACGNENNSLASQTTDEVIPSASVSSSAPGSESIETTDETTSDNQATEWNEITEDGVDEELLLSSVDEELLVYIANELQLLVEEEMAAEEENPEILLVEGWVRVFDSEHYANVMDLGEKAMKPLYCIIYESSSEGLYEYICATALYELSGYDFTNDDGSLKWVSSKELLALFNQEIIAERG